MVKVFLLARCKGYRIIALEDPTPKDAQGGAVIYK